MSMEEEVQQRLQEQAAADRARAAQERAFAAAGRAGVEANSRAVAEFVAICTQRGYPPQSVPGRTWHDPVGKPSFFRHFPSTVHGWPIGHDHWVTVDGRLCRSTRMKHWWSRRAPESLGFGIAVQTGSDEYGSNPRYTSVRELLVDTLTELAARAGHERP
jgi:hypothetical protein